MKQRIAVPRVAGVLFGLLAGCGSTVVTAPSLEDAGVDTGGEVAVIPGVDSGVTSLPDVPTRADVRPDVAPDGPTSCSFSGASGVVINYRPPGTAAFDCSGLPVRPSSTEAVVRTASVVSVEDDATGSTLTLDFCSPALDCAPMLGTLRVAAPGFNLGSGPLGLGRGQYVTIRSRVTWSWACTLQVELRNAPTWDGFPNPVRTANVLLAAASRGEVTPLPGAPFGLSRQGIGCAQSGGMNCGGGVPELFALSFQGHCRNCESDPPPVVVRQGSTDLLMVDSEAYLARNVRSYNTGACDDYWNYAWTVRERWLE